MIVSLVNFNCHIIELDPKILPYLEGKDNIHEVLVCGTNVLEAEGHGIVIVVAMI